MKEVAEVDEQNKDLKKAVKATKKISPRKGGAGAEIIGHAVLPDASATLPAPELETKLQVSTSLANKDFEAYKKSSKIPKL